MDILRVLTSAALEVRQKTLALALELVTSRNIDEVQSICYKSLVVCPGNVHKI